MNQEWLLGAVGDIFLNRADPDLAFARVTDLLRAPTLQFGNCEGAFTDSATVAPSAGFRVVSGNATALTLAPPGST